MQKLLIIVSSIVFLTSCKQIKTNSKQNLTIDTPSKPEQEVTPDIKQERQEYILSYSKPITFESLHNGRNGEKIKVLGKYYCLVDNSIVIPGKYNLDDTTNAFVTHNFAEDVIIVINADTILKKTITKRDFVDKLPQYLKDYAVIFEPKFEGYDSDSDSFDFSFSISIPMTDVGQLMNLSIKRDGSILVTEAK